MLDRIEKFSKGWRGGLPETPCGLGSTAVRTEKQVKWIGEILDKYRIKSIADIGAGDLNWIKNIDLSKVDYKAYDLIPRVSNVEYFDLLTEVPPRVDLIICLWVINHLTEDEMDIAIQNIKASKSKYIIMANNNRWIPNKIQTLEKKNIDILDLSHKSYLTLNYL